MDFYATITTMSIGNVLTGNFLFIGDSEFILRRTHGGRHRDLVAVDADIGVLDIIVRNLNYS
jgi:hypothetical protein